MFRRIFAALAQLSAALESLTATVEEARANFRENLGLDGAAEPQALQHKPTVGRGKKKSV